MHASNPARLTMYPPNHLAHSLFLDTRKRVNAGLSRGQRAQKICWVSISVIIGGFGVMACVILLAKGEGAIVPFLFMLLVLMPGMLCALWLLEKWQHLAPDKVLEVMGDILDGRAREIMTTMGVGGGAFLAAYEPQLGDKRGTLVVDCFPDGLGPFRALQRGGYASIPSWATYHAAWKALLSRLGSEGDRLAVVEMHTKWIELLSKIAVAADGLTSGMDVQRMKAYKRLARQGMDFAGDTLSDLADIGGMFSDMKDMKESLEKIKEAVTDTKEAYKAYGIDADWENDRPEGGLHPIQQRRLAFMIPFICLCFFLPALSFGLLGVPAGAWAMVGVGVFMVIASSWFATRINASMQLLECIVDLEVKQRAILARLIQAKARGDLSVHQLVAATDKLRDVLVENYYAALAIHMQSEALTFRPFPYPGNPPMLVPRPEGDDGLAGKGGATDPSGEQEIEVVLPVGAGEPEIVVENNAAAEPTPLGEPGLPIVTAMDTPQPNNLTIPVQAHDTEGEPIQEGKTVEMTIKPDGTKTIKTTTTVRNPDGTTTTTTTMSTVNEDSASEVPDYFHDEEAGVVHL